MTINAHFLVGDFDPKYTRLTQFLVCNRGSLAGVRTQDYKSLCAAAMICVTLVNIQIQRQTAF